MTDAAKPQLAKWSIKAVANKRKRYCIIPSDHTTFLVQRKLTQSVPGSVHIPAYLREMQVLVHITQVKGKGTHQLLIKYLIDFKV